MALRKPPSLFCKGFLGRGLQNPGWLPEMNRAIRPLHAHLARRFCSLYRTKGHLFFSKAHSLFLLSVARSFVTSCLFPVSVLQNHVGPHL